MSGSAPVWLARLREAVMAASASRLRHVLTGIILAGTFAGAVGAGALVAAEPAPLGPETSVPTLLAAAAIDLTNRMDVDGPGLRWEAIQDQVASTANGESSLVLSVLARGYLRENRFVQEIRHAVDVDRVHDFDAAVFDFGTVIKDDRVWRNEGDGFFETTRARIPGIGIDPFTLTRLPGLLRRLTDVRDLGIEVLGQTEARHFAGRGDAADWPGIVASDGLRFTGASVAIDVWVTDGGRLVRLAGGTQNLAQTTRALSIRTSVTFATDPPATLAEPVPVLVGEPRPRP